MKFNPVIALVFLSSQVVAAAGTMTISNLPSSEVEDHPVCFDGNTGKLGNCPNWGLPAVVDGEGEVMGGMLNWGSTRITVLNDAGYRFITSKIDGIVASMGQPTIPDNLAISPTDCGNIEIVNADPSGNAPWICQDDVRYTDIDCQTPLYGLITTESLLPHMASRTVHHRPESDIENELFYIPDDPAVIKFWFTSRWEYTWVDFNYVTDATCVIDTDYFSTLEHYPNDPNITGVDKGIKLNPFPLPIFP